MHKHDFFFLVGLLTEFKLGIEFYNTACHNLNMATRKKNIYQQPKINIF